jgi:hypothetical protein
MSDDSSAASMVSGEIGEQDASDTGENVEVYEPVAGKKRKRVIATELEPEKLKQFEEAEKRKGVVRKTKRRYPVNTFGLYPFVAGVSCVHPSLYEAH